ncbi:alpha-galactosidase [Virgisporangium ochraceum]|uniref:alpha-galactosidase n=1 Tax=Virgisporangium ochraceum TaxID=65505 RepID=A0A8J4A4U4_9ACTN|nr:alpha-galactosidase [Virgisporangium ochraceum]GIJ73875.1 hypothetical protein Voc01_087920 [Virgisporangium ochraceum]
MTVTVGALVAAVAGSATGQTPPSTVVGQTGNLLPNGGFDVGDRSTHPADWAVDGNVGGTAIIATAANIASGKGSLRITNVSGGTVTVTSPRAVAVPGKTYTVTAKVKGASGTLPILALVFTSFENTVLDTRAVSPTFSTAFQTVTVQGVAPERTANVSVRISATPTEVGQSYWDDVWLSEAHIRRQVLAVGKLVLESRRGVPGHAHQPWLAVDGPSSSEEHGEIWSIAVAHGGSWKLVAELSGYGHTHVTAGLNDFDLRLVLAPGERLDLPETVGVYGPAGYADLTARWHRYERGFVLPRPTRVRPVLCNSWESTFFDVRHDDQVALAKRTHDLGVELFVVDDGWFADRADDAGGLGDWRTDPAKLPHGLAALADEVHALGMRFGLWVEPEAVTPDSDLFRAHPDRVMRWPDRDPAAVRHSYGLDFGRTDVRDWAFGTLDRLVREGRVDFLKWDLNRSLTDTTGAGQFHHEAGFRSVVDRLRAAHPDLWLETCASGGGRADLASLSRFELSWPSDNTDALERLSIQEGYALVHSPLTMSCWVTDSPGYLSHRPVPLRFRFHVAMTGLLGIGGTIGRWPAGERAEAAGYVARYKEIRDTVQLGHRYRLGSARHDERFAVCCVAADGAQVALFVFARTVRQDGGDPPVRLRGLDPHARYRDVDSGTAYGGAFLMRHGLRPLLRGDYASALFVLERV